MTITDDWGIEIHGAVFESGNGYCVQVVPEGINSFDNRFFDMTRALYPGDVSGIDIPAARMLNFSWIIAGTSNYDAPGNLDYVYPLRQALAVAWAPEFNSSEITLDVKVPGAPTATEVLRFYGRPRSLVTRKSAVAGYEAVLATFRALDPLAYGPATAVPDTSTPVVFDALGDYATSRFVITVVGNGGLPSIISLTDGDKQMNFNTAFSDTAILDFRAQTVTVSSVDYYGLLAPAPEWFSILPGTNTITFTGCASIAISYEPAYL